MMGWLSRKPVPSACPIDMAAEAKKLEQALNAPVWLAACLIMNDDIEGAEAGLKSGDSPFHKLGKGLVAFVKAILGFEKEVMKEASELLAAADKSAGHEYRRLKEWLDAQDPGSVPYHGVYRPETVYLLCQSMAQLMSALVGVLNETLKESAIAFYKLNKAYSTLERIMQMEEAYLLKNKRKSCTSLKNPKSGSSTPQHVINDDPESEVFKGAFDVFTHAGANLCFGALMLFLSIVPPTFQTLLSIVGFRGDRDRGLRMLWQASKFDNLLGAIAGLALLDYYNAIIRSTIIIPDLTGDSDKDVSTYPVDRLHTLLKDMRTRFPNSQLWLLEGSRMLAFDRRLDLALESLTACEVSPLKQVEALHMFELSFDAMYSHRYELCAESFIKVCPIFLILPQINDLETKYGYNKCIDLNSWSQALYVYNAACCYVVLYRKAGTDKAAAEKWAKKATDLFGRVSDYAGKKKFLASQLPFDVYVLRKVNKFQDRAKRMGVSLVDAVGVDPIEEMIFLWNGPVRMNPRQLEESWANLAWSEEGEVNAKKWAKETHDEKMLMAIVKAGILREQRRHEEAKKLLTEEILKHPEPTKDPHHEDWVKPIAHFEVANNAWMQRSGYHPFNPTEQLDGEGRVEAYSASSSRTSVNGTAKEDAEVDRKLVAECKEHIDKLAKWHAYELHARFGMKVTMAQGTIQRWQTEHHSLA
ncbi:Mitochondrial outer membrane protein iml2 [Ascosphaera pollenicola]|nr:Mitochondrial outer membrane protein iml2 [Ascosphaera pollenicola]